MRTWAIGSMGGQVARGIPSEDVAVSIARDLLQYDDNYEDALEDWQADVKDLGKRRAGPRPTWRQNVTITQEEDDYEPGRTWVLLTTEAEHRGLGVGPEEERCDHCGRLPTSGLGLP